MAAEHLDVARVMDELNFYCYLNLAGLKLSSHTWLIANVLHSSDLDRSKLGNQSKRQKKFFFKIYSCTADPGNICFYIFYLF